ncbi:MAG: hybrid sensor histidine kinase/response regulator [Hyphomicrobiales bacterium]|nr:MAG: hybrid sensor histidine kinase/response regulator [Hyphomicrobiales bacterium]
MDDLLSEFLTETAESLDVVDVELVKFEQNPNDEAILANIFRLVHTIKGTCGFLGLPRLEALAHAAETLMGKFRDGAPVTGEAVTVILQSLDRIKDILADLEENETEPEGSDDDLISQLDTLSAGKALAAEDAGEDTGADEEVEDLGLQVLERELKPGEVSLEELERVFQETECEEDDGMIDLSAEAADGEDDAEADAPEAKSEPAPKPAAKAAPAKPAGKSPERKQGKGLSAQSIRVNVDTLEHLMTMVSELVLTRNQLLQMVRRLDDSEFKAPLQRLSNVTGELQEGVMKTRMQPIGNAWQKLPRIVRDLANDLGKKIDLEMIGAETELDRQVLEMIKDPLTHIVRNSADHGLEDTEGRIAADKPETGKITLKAYHEGGHIIIEIIDDGRGLNAEKIKEKVIMNGLATEAELEQMPESQIHKFIFNAGFSTATKVTNVSGRGVGMDVVRTNIELIGGSVDLNSRWGVGTTLSIKIPLTLAIVSALIVTSGEHRFAVPQLNVVELVRAHKQSEHRIEMINDTPVLRLRSKLLPLIYLNKLLNIEPEEQTDEERGRALEEGFIIVAQVGPQTFGIVVDSVFDTEEIVVKPMSTLLRDNNMFSGNTILGDGSVIMIVDPNGLAQAISDNAVAAAASNEADEIVNTSETLGKVTSMLMFRAGSTEPKAVPLSLVTRLEEIDVESIEPSNGHDLVQYRGQLMPLVRISPDAKLKDKGRQPILVFSDDSHSMGLVVDEIVDIVEDQLNIEVESEIDGMLGSAVIKGQATEIVDVTHYLILAHEDWLKRKEHGVDSRTRSLLLVDDSAFFRNMLTPVLNTAGYDVTAVESVAEAMRLKAMGNAYDVIISDIEMPEVDGFHFAESLREDSDWGHTPIIALSSLSTPAAIKRGREVGFADYIAKFDRQGLIESLRETFDEDLGAAA